MSVTDYIYSFQDSPIILVGGAAGTGKLPISMVINAEFFPQGITQPGTPSAKPFASFRPVPGNTLVVNEVATYPFANQAVAANAVIASPLAVSIEMVLPMTSELPMWRKLGLITNLKSTIDQHTALGGYYIVVTPTFVYNTCLLTSLVDATDLDYGAQPQTRFIWNFEQPLLTSEQLQAAQNPTMSRITDQTQNVSAPTEPAGNFLTNVSNPAANFGQNYIPASSGALGSNVPPSTASGLGGLGATFGF